MEGERLDRATDEPKAECLAGTWAGGLQIRVELFRLTESRQGRPRQRDDHPGWSWNAYHLNRHNKSLWGYRFILLVLFRKRTLLQIGKDRTVEMRKMWFRAVSLKIESTHAGVGFDYLCCSVKSGYTYENGQHSYR